jgi:type III pantothenate kinase
MVEAMVRRFKEEIGDYTKVVATGGMASLIQKETSIFDAVNMDLTLIGLRLIYQLNADAKKEHGDETHE